MTTVTGLTAERMQEIIDAQYISAEIVGTHLILTRADGSELDAGDVGSTDYRSRINLALGLMGTTFCFFNNKADQPVNLMNYADGDLDRHTVIHAVGLENSIEDDDFAPRIDKGEMLVDPPTVGGSAGYPLAIVNERFNSVAIVGGFMPPIDEENPATDLAGFALISGHHPSTDPLEFIFGGSVHIGYYPSGIQAGVVHPVGTTAPAGPGLEVIGTHDYFFDVPIDGELNKVMGYRFVEPDTLYITGPSGQIVKSQSEYYGLYWPNDDVAGFIFEIARPFETLTTDPEPRLIGFALGEPGTPVDPELPIASATEQGVVELATETEAFLGTDTTRAVTPLGGYVTKSVDIINTQVDDYSLVATDLGKIVAMNKATAVSLTVPANATVPHLIGTRISIWQQGAGEVTIVPAGGVTIRSSDSMKLRGQYSWAQLVKVNTNEWVLSGDLKTDQWHNVGDVGEPAFENGWVNLVGAGIMGGEGTAFETPLRFRKVRDMVLVEGFVDAASATDNTVFNLPVGYRPSKFFAAMGYAADFAGNSAPVAINVWTDPSFFGSDKVGDVTADSAVAATTPYQFINLRFLAEA